jgi:histidinol-phosphate/aromatic aminotransferase/cobyric acid decarboxylase-like protein
MSISGLRCESVTKVFPDVTNFLWLAARSEGMSKFAQMLMAIGWPIRALTHGIRG